MNWPSICSTIRSHQFSLNDNPIGAFRRVCCEPLEGDLDIFQMVENPRLYYVIESHNTQLLAHWRLRMTASLISTHWFNTDFCVDRRVIKTHWTCVHQAPMGGFTEQSGERDFHFRADWLSSHSMWYYFQVSLWVFFFLVSFIKCYKNLKTSHPSFLAATHQQYFKDKLE